MASFGWPLGLFLIAIGLIILANLINTIIVAEVNRKLADSEQINYFFWYPGKFGKVKRLYKLFYPQGQMEPSLTCVPGSQAPLCLLAHGNSDSFGDCGNQTALLPLLRADTQHDPASNLSAAKLL